MCRTSKSKQYFSAVHVGCLHAATAFMQQWCMLSQLTVPLAVDQLLASLHCSSVAWVDTQHQHVLAMTMAIPLSTASSIVLPGASNSWLFLVHGVLCWSICILLWRCWACFGLESRLGLGNVCTERWCSRHREMYGMV
jgi:hypothetical protein